MDVLVCVGRELSGPCLQGYQGELGYRSQVGCIGTLKAGSVGPSGLRAL